MLNYPEARMTVPSSAITRIGGEFVLKHYNHFDWCDHCEHCDCSDHCEQQNESLLVIYNANPSADQPHLSPKKELQTKLEAFKKVISRALAFKNII